MSGEVAKERTEKNIKFLEYAVEVLSLSHHSSKESDEYDQNKAFRDINTLLENYHFLEMYNSVRFWNVCIYGVYRSLRSFREEAVMPLKFWGYLYVLLNEAYKVDDVGRFLEDGLQDLSYKVGVIVAKSNKDNMKDGYGSSLKKIYKRYHEDWSEEFSRVREKDEREKIIEREVENRFKYFRDLEKSMSKRLEEAKGDIRAAQGETSFISSYEGIKKYSNKVAFNLYAVKVLRYVIMAIILALPVLVYNSISSSEAYDSSGTIYYNQGAGSNDQELNRERSLVAIIKSGVDSFTIKYALVYLSGILLLVFMFRVLLREEKELERVFHDLEYKAAMTSFHKAYLEVVNEFGGNVQESINRYEDFVYSPVPQGNADVPDVTDSLNKTLQHVEKIVKAARSGK